MCPEKLADFTINLIFGSGQEFLGFFGCRTLDDASHDEGAWILTSTTNDLPNNPQEILESFREAVKNMSATTTDFLINDFSVEQSCQCPTCDYTMYCPSDDTQTAVYEYYGEVDFSNYPQDVVNDSSNEYGTYPNYNVDYNPVYYYYDDSLNGPAQVTTENIEMIQKNATESSNWQAQKEEESTTKNSAFTDVNFVTQSSSEGELMNDFQGNNNKSDSL